jgi:DNA-binding SARP family transcriptional activator/TolB-like protein
MAGLQNSAVVEQPLLSVSVLGAVKIAFSGRDIKVRLRKSRALLAYIALNENLSETRERLAGLLWSESDQDHAYASLRQSVHELKEAFEKAGFCGFQIEELVVGFERASIDVDLSSVIRDSEGCRVHPLLLHRSRLADSLLQGFDDLDPSFQVWLLAERRILHDRLLRALEDGLRNEAVDAGTRIRLAEAIINLDCTHEEACRHVMKAKAEAGDVAGAEEVYKRLYDCLDDEYNMEPSAETRQLRADILTGKIKKLAPGEPIPPYNGTARNTDKQAPTPLPAKIELCMDTFGKHGVEPDREHLVEGFRRHLIACLVRFREWYVTDRSSQSSPGAAGPAVSARYAIEGAGYQAGSLLHLVLTLKEISTNQYVWSDNVRLAPDNWFEVQQRVVRRVAMALNVKVSTERLMRLVGQPEVELDIWDRWLRGQSMIANFGSENRKKAAEIFEQIIREAPDFSPAYSSLAQIYNADHIAFPGVFRNPDKERQSLELATTAVRLDPTDSRAHLCLGWSLIMAKHYAQAETPIRSACELNENDPWTLISSALVLAFCAKFDRAQDLAGQALDLSLLPLPAHWGYLADLRFLCADYQGCIDAATQAGDIPSARSAWVAAAQFHLGRRREAAEEAQRFLARIRSNWFGETPPTDAMIAQWFLHLYPICRREDWERLRNGLRGAGVPVDGIDHHDW